MTSWIESQTEARSKQDAASLERAYAELASSVTNVHAAPHFDATDMEQTDGAARVCLKYIGVKAGTVPEDVKDIDERIDWLCRPTGTMRRNVRLEKGWHTRAFGAMLGRLDTGEAVALLPRGVSGYCYLDPITGEKHKITQEVAEDIEDDAVLFYRPLPAKPCKARDLVTFIFKVFDLNDYLLVFTAALAVTLVGLAPAWANQVAFGVVAPSGQARLILPIAALLLGVAVSTALITACRNLVMGRISIKLDVVTEAATFSRVLALPSSFFKEYSSGDLASRVATVTTLTQQLASMLLGTGLTAMLSIVYVVQISGYAPALALPALAITVLQAALTVFSIMVSARYEKESMAASAKLSGEVTALLGGIQKIKLAGAEDRAFAKWAHGYASYARPTYGRPVIVNALPAIVGLVGLVGIIAIYYLAATSKISVANYMAFNVAYGQVTAAIMAFANIAGQAARIGPMIDMVAPILEATPETAEDKPSVESLAGSIEVLDVSFRYGENQPYVLHNLSFNVRPGEYVALVGASGCGKSTILRLLLGFEEPERGSIFFGSNDVTKVDLRSLLQHIGVVMQDGQLFMGDIASNITISAPTATIDDAWEAAEIAGIAEDIRKMPMGMQTFVTEGGGGVSGGQRQRLMIARAVCGKRSILMLDEATSALDNVTQKHVADSLATLKCTRLVVAHRLSTVKHCDRILVVADGHIAEEGTYEELIERKGVFADLVERQR
ncbi:MAG: ATP-binding cassette domain-containing protein, partial [Eggerthellaceae bacterium]|nr:ATP-binding cassette domain-containing protein [Eggerthellaceae bacterium]